MVYLFETVFFHHWIPKFAFYNSFDRSLVHNILSFEFQNKHYVLWDYDIFRVASATNTFKISRLCLMEEDYL